MSVLLFLVLLTFFFFRMPRDLVINTAEHHFSPEASLSSAETPRKSKGYDFSMVEAIFLSGILFL
jgi:hypothetical protein